MSPATTKYVSLFRTRQVSTIIGMIVLFWLGGCATLQLPVETSDSALRARAVSDTVKEVTLSASVLSAADSEQLFGTDINSTGVQPVWIEVRNNSTHTLWLMRAGTIPATFHPWKWPGRCTPSLPKKSNASIDAYFNAHSFQSPDPTGVNTQWHPVHQSPLGYICLQCRSHWPADHLSVHPVSTNTR